MDISLTIWSASLLLAFLLGGIIILWNLNHSLKPWTRCAHKETDPLPQEGYRRCRRCGTLLDKDGREISSEEIIHELQRLRTTKH